MELETKRAVYDVYDAIPKTTIGGEALILSCLCYRGIITNPKPGKAPQRSRIRGGEGKKWQAEKENGSIAQLNIPKWANTRTDGKRQLISTQCGRQSEFR